MRYKTNVFTVRQICLETAVCLTSYTLGTVIAFPSVLNPAILAPDADIKASPDQASWIATCLIFGGLIGFAFLPIVFEFFGRKTASIVTNIFFFIGNLILYVASDVYSLAFARLTQGMAIGGTFMSTLSLCECLSPKRRGYFMVLNYLFFCLGSLVCRCLGLILIWRQIALFSALGNLISLILYSMTAESPAFLAMREEFDKCAENFVWYRGDTLSAKKELKELISAQTENFRINEIENDKSVFKTVKNVIMTKDFQKSLCIGTLAALCLDTCGRYSLFAIITDTLTNNITLPLKMSDDFVTLFAVAISSVMIKNIKRRTLLFISGFCSVFLMFMVSFSSILRSKFTFTLTQDMDCFTASVVLLHTFTTNIGMIPVIFALSGEIFSLNQKSFGSIILGIIFIMFYSVITKLTRLMIRKTGLEGTLSIHGCLLFIFLVLLRMILPETKDKTLQEIEDEMKGVARHANTLEIRLLK